MPAASILTGWVRGCGDSGPARPSRPVPRPPHRAPPARCPNLCRWPWQLREDPLQGEHGRREGHYRGLCGRPSPGRGVAVAGGVRQNGIPQRCEQPLPQASRAGSAARVPAVPGASCSSLAADQRVPMSFLPVSKRAGRPGRKGWRGRNSIPPLAGSARAWWLEGAVHSQL